MTPGPAVSAGSWVCKGPIDDTSKMGDLKLSGDQINWTLTDWNATQHMATLSWTPPPLVLADGAQGELSISISPWSGSEPAPDQ